MKAVNKLRLAGLAVGLALGAAPLGAHATILYANANFVSTNDLYRIDTVAMTSAFIGNTDVGHNFGLADWNGNLYGFDQDADVVKQIDPATGTTLNTYNVGIATAGEGAIAFDSTGGGFLGQCPIGTLWGFDIGGPSSSSIGTMSTCMDGMDFNSSDVLYGLAQLSADLYTINTANAAITLVGSTGISPGALSGLTFDGNDLYAITSGGDLYSIDSSNGSSTLLFNTGLTNVSGLSALDVPTDVPEPATLCLFGTGLFGFAAARRRRKAA